MKKIYAIFVTIALAYSSVALCATDSTINTYKVTFYNITSQNNGLPQQACNEMMKTFSFNVQGKNYNFNQDDNPTYSNHQALAFLTLKDDQFLELDNVSSRFSYKNKIYNYISSLSSITYTNPFILKGVIINPYCKAAYIVLLDNPQGLTSTTVKSVSPTS